MSPPLPLSHEADLVALCAALGAGEHPSPLSDDERALLDAADACTDELVTTAADLILESGDPLGDAFCALRPPLERRASGAFYTPALVVDAMVSWVLSRTPARVVDAGCGSGRFAFAFIDAGFTGTVVAVDSDPLATLMVRAAAQVRGVHIEVRNESFLTLDLDPLTDGQRTAFVGNPPFVRHHGLPAEVKTWAKQTAAELGCSVSGLAGLHALFFVAAARLSSPGDVGAFITSSEWLEARYGQVVRDLLAGPLGAVRLDVVDPRAEVFADAATTAVISSFEAGHSGPVSVRAIADTSELCALAGGRVVSRDRLAGSRRWSELSSPPRRVDPSRVRLGSLFSVSRGVATGANKFFVLPTARVEELGLEAFAHPVVARAADVLGADGAIRPDALTKRLLVFPSADLTDEAADYVAAGVLAGVHEGYVCSHRRPWWRVPLPSPAVVFATCMARQPPRFALNAAGAVSLNTVHALRPRDGVPAWVAAALVDWLNAHGDELVGGRVYQGGLIKVEPSEMEGFLVPPLEQLEQLAQAASDGV